MWFIMTIVFYISFGLMIGVILMSLIANSSYKHKCDDCDYAKICDVFELWGTDDE